MAKPSQCPVAKSPFFCTQNLQIRRHALLGKSYASYKFALDTYPYVLLESSLAEWSNVRGRAC